MLIFLAVLEKCKMTQVKLMVVQLKHFNVLSCEEHATIVNRLLVQIQSCNNFKMPRQLNWLEHVPLKHGVLSSSLRRGTNFKLIVCCGFDSHLRDYFSRNRYRNRNHTIRTFYSAIPELVAGGRLLISWRKPVAGSSPACREIQNQQRVIRLTFHQFAS